MADTAACKQNTQALWQALYDRAWDRVGEFFAEDGLYQDVPAPDMGAVGPAAVARRLKIGHEPVERHEGAEVYAGPAVRKMARELGVELLDDLDAESDRTRQGQELAAGVKLEIRVQLIPSLRPVFA